MSVMCTIIFQRPRYAELVQLFFFFFPPRFPSVPRPPSDWLLNWLHDKEFNFRKICHGLDIPGLSDKPDYNKQCKQWCNKRSFEVKGREDKKGRRLEGRERPVKDREEHHRVVAKLVSFNLPLCAVACLICTVYLTNELNFPRKEVTRCPADKTMIPLARSLFSDCRRPISVLHLKSLWIQEKHQNLLRRKSVHLMTWGLRVVKYYYQKYRNRAKRMLRAQPLKDCRAIPQRFYLF